MRNLKEGVQGTPHKEVIAFNPDLKEVREQDTGVSIRGRSECKGPGAVRGQQEGWRGWSRAQERQKWVGVDHLGACGHSRGFYPE